MVSALLKELREEFPKDSIPARDQQPIGTLNAAPTRAFVLLSMPLSLTMIPLLVASSGHLMAHSSLLPDQTSRPVHNSATGTFVKCFSSAMF